MSATTSELHEHVRAGNLLWRRTFIPIGFTLLLSVFQIFAESESNSPIGNINQLLLTNSAGVLTTLLWEAIRRWTAEERVIKLTRHIPTDSPVFGEVASLVENIDLVVREAQKLSAEQVLGTNPVVNQLRDHMVDLASHLEDLKSLNVWTERDNNLLSVQLVEKVERVWAINNPRTDLGFWQSIPGKKYWEAHERNRTLLSAQTSPPPGPSRTGVVRIFIIADSPHLYEEMILEQASKGVKVYLYRQSSEYPISDEFAIFGHIAVRETERGRDEDRPRNRYAFGESEIRKAEKRFEVLFNQSVPLIEPGETASIDLVRDKIKEIRR